jgi:hypothetical protein
MRKCFLKTYEKMFLKTYEKMFLKTNAFSPYTNQHDANQCDVSLLKISQVWWPYYGLVKFLYIFEDLSRGFGLKDF